MNTEYKNKEKTKNKGRALKPLKSLRPSLPPSPRKLHRLVFSKENNRPTHTRTKKYI